MIEQLGSGLHHISEDRFTAGLRRNVPGKDKPTPALTGARRENIKKAQAARHKDD